MFSRLDPLFKTSFRETEQLDTRLGIREDEEREDPNKGKEHKRKEETSESVDVASVSVEALAGFLRNLMTTEDVSAYIPEDQMPNGSQAAAKAASAYQKMADRSHSSHPPVSQGVDTKLSPQEKVLITRLIVDLDYLSQHGVRQLAIGNSNSGLLEGFIEAAERAKEQLG